MIPPVGGDTAFVDLQAAYDALSAPVRELIDGLDAEHDGRAEFAEHLRERPDGGIWSGRRFTVLEPVTYPAAGWVHPDTGRRGLFVNPTFTTRIAGLTRSESTALLGLLHEVVIGRGAHVPPPVGARNDVVAWDNRATMHLGVRDDAMWTASAIASPSPVTDASRTPAEAAYVRAMRGRAGSRSRRKSRHARAGSAPGSALEDPSKPPAWSISTWAQPCTPCSTSQVRMRSGSSERPPRRCVR